MSDYGQFAETQLDPQRLASLTALAIQQMAAEDAVKEATAELKRRMATLLDLAEKQIPDLMEELRMAKFTLVNGAEVEVTSKVRHGITVANRPKAFKWLDDNGHSGLIKRTIAVAFNREEQGMASALLMDLSSRGMDCRQEQKVEPATMGKFVSEMVKAGKSIPLDLFGAYEQRNTKIKRKK